DRLTIRLLQLVATFLGVVPFQFLHLLLGAYGRSTVLLQVLPFFRPRGSFPHRAQTLKAPEASLLNRLDYHPPLVFQSLQLALYDSTQIALQPLSFWRCALNGGHRIIQNSSLFVIAG